MNLFKNKVGRPSNEIKQNRQIFIISMVTLLMVLLTLGLVFLANLRLDRLKGAASSSDIKIVKSTVGTNPSYCKYWISNIKTFDANVNWKCYGEKASTTMYVKKIGVSFSNQSYIDSHSVAGIDYKNRLSGNLGISYIFNTSRVSNELNSNTWYTVYLTFYDPTAKAEYSGNINFKTNEIIIKCDKKIVKVGEKVACKSNVPMEVYHWKNDNKYIAISGNNTSNIVFKVKQYSEYWNAPKKLGFQLVPSSTGNTHRLLNIKTVSFLAAELRLTCPKSVYVGEKFKCTTNSTKATVRVSTGGLSDHYLDLLEKNNGRFKTPKKEINLMYTKKGTAKVVAEQSGFKSVTKEIEIRDLLKLSCPTSAKVGEKFTCTTNEEGATISVTSTGLANGYSSKFVTTKNDKSKTSMYMENGYKTVTVSKKGYNTVTKNVLVTGITEMKFDCPTSAKVGQAFKCTTNLENVIITIKGCELERGYTNKFTTTAKDKAKLTACRNAGTVTVEAYHDSSRRQQQKITKKVNLTK